MKLTADEQSWLYAYREALDRKYPNLVEEFILFGSKARGDDREDSDLDVLLIIQDGDWRRKMDLTDLGCDLALGTDTAPSIVILTQAEQRLWESNDSTFLDTVRREGISLR